MRIFQQTLIIVACFVLLCGCQNGKKKVAAPTNTIFQYSTLSALLEGVYDGNLTIGQLKEHGNFGIGTFNALDGELVLADGKCFKVQSDSKVVEVSNSELSPFAAACTFVADTVLNIEQLSLLKDVENKIDSLVPSANLMYAYKIVGEFDSIVIRSVPKQQKPYLRLIEAYKKQGVYTFPHENGLLFGYKFPKYLKDVNMDGYHFHFLSEDKLKGGHLLNCKISKARIEVAYIRNYQLELPKSNYFNASTLENKKAELSAIEGGDTLKK